MKTSAECGVGSAESGVSRLLILTPDSELRTPHSALI